MPTTHPREIHGPARGVAARPGFPCVPAGRQPAAAGQGCSHLLRCEPQLALGLRSAYLKTRQCAGRLNVKELLDVFRAEQNAKRSAKRTAVGAGVVLLLFMLLLGVNAALTFAIVQLRWV